MALKGLEGHEETHRKASSINSSPSSKLCVIYPPPPKKNSRQNPRKVRRESQRKEREEKRQTLLIPMPSTTVSTWCRRFVPSRSLRSNITPYLTCSPSKSKSQKRRESRTGWGGGIK